MLLFVIYLVSTMVQNEVTSKNAYKTINKKLTKESRVEY